jgi:N-hydroxyarylamine O-acetyltransferase
VRQVVALRTEPEIRYALRGTELTTTRPDGATASVAVDVDDLPGLLADRFGVGLDPDEQAALRDAHATVQTS